MGELSQPRTKPLEDLSVGVKTRKSTAVKYNTLTYRQVA